MLPVIEGKGESGRRGRGRGREARGECDHHMNVISGDIFVIIRGGW
jgi:hypothetical protein